MSPPASPENPLADFDPESLLGLPRAEARRRVEAAGGVLRAVAPGAVVTLDYRSNRITVTVEDDLVTAVNGVG